ncbi:MAG: hypothetical protein J6N72_07970 [Psychrobacter sp.]|nr:hypothetical protein [Psychrobacter sp.]
MPLQTPVTCTFTCSAAAKTRVLQAFQEIAHDSRLNPVKLFVPNGTEGIFEGSHSLTEVFITLVGENVADSSNNAVKSILGNKDCSDLEVLDKCHTLLTMMSKTEWLRDSEIIIEGKSGVFKAGTYSFMSLVDTLAQLTKKSFNTRLNETSLDFTKTLVTAN